MELRFSIKLELISLSSGPVKVDKFREDVYSKLRLVTGNKNLIQSNYVTPYGYRVKLQLNIWWKIVKNAVSD